MGSGGDLWVQIRFGGGGCATICTSFVEIFGGRCWRPGEGIGFVAARCYFSLGLYFWLGSISLYSFKLGLCEMIVFWLWCISRG